MQDENLIILIGRCGAAPEFKNHNGTKVTKFPLATTKKWKSKEGDLKEKTTWHNIVCFGHSADYARDYIVKGAEVYVNGSQDNYSFTKDDGDKAYGHQVNVNHISANRYEKKDKSHQSPPNDMSDFNIPDNVDE